MCPHLGIRMMSAMNTTPALRGVGLAVLASLSALVLPAHPAGAISQKKPVTGIVSVALNGSTANGNSLESDLSGLGRSIAFSSTGTNIVAGDTNGTRDVFVRNTQAAATTRVSVSTAGVPGNGPSDQPSISHNGRWVVFRSTATNLVAGDTNGKADIFRRDLQLGTTTRVSVANVGAKQLTGDSRNPGISYDGNEVVFESDAPNALDWDLNTATDVFVRNISGDFTQMETLTSSELALTAGGSTPDFSGDGRYVVFQSATNQVGIDTNSKVDIFLRDRVAGTTEKVSTASNGDQADGPSSDAHVSDNGRFIVFESDATDLTSAVDKVERADVFRRDRTLATTILVTRNTASNVANEGGNDPRVSADGNKVAFSSESTNLAADSNGTQDTFVRDIGAATTTRTSVTTNGAQLNGLSFAPQISADGTATAFATTAQNTYPGDTNNLYDIYWRGSNETGPFSDTTGLIQHSANDFNGADLSLPQLIALNDRVLSGVASPESTIDDLAHGTFDNSRGPVMRLYWAFFKRVPDLGGLNYWVKKHQGGTSLKVIASSFAKSNEFTTKFGGGSDTAFITLVYTNVLERQPDPAGLDHWVNALKKGGTRGEMMINFSESSEGIRKMRGEVDTILISLALLHRLPTPGEFSGWVNLLESGWAQPTEVLIFSIVVSPAYARAVAT